MFVSTDANMGSFRVFGFEQSDVGEIAFHFVLLVGKQRKGKREIDVLGFEKLGMLYILFYFIFYIISQNRTQCFSKVKF